MTKRKATTKLTGDELRAKLAERARRLPWRQFSDSLLPDEHRELTFFGGSAVDFWRTYNADETVRSHATKERAPRVSPSEVWCPSCGAAVGIKCVSDGRQNCTEGFHDSRVTAATAINVRRQAIEQPKKSHAQIKREVDEILAGRHSKIGIQLDPGEWWDSLSRSDRQTVAEGSLAGSVYEDAVLWLPGRAWKTIRPDTIREVLWKGLSRVYPIRRTGRIRT